MIELGNLTNLDELGLWGNNDLTGAANQALVNLGKRIDRAALRVIYDENNGEAWKNKTNWLELGGKTFTFSEWYGVETNSDGRVSELNLSSNDLEGDIVTSFEALKDLERLDLSYNAGLTGELTQRLEDLSSLHELNIRCTSITTPTAASFQVWLQGITFTKTQAGDTCSSSSPTPGQVTGVTVTAGVESLSVSWDEVTDADGYKVQWKSGMQSFDSTRQHIITGGSTTSYTISNLTAGTEYTVRVIATKSGAGDGEPSEEAVGIPDSKEPEEPEEPSQSTSSGGCSIVSENAVSNMSETTLFNLLFVVSLVFFTVGGVNLRNFLQRKIKPQRS